RTYLRSADVSVAAANRQFLPSLEIDRRDLFAEDVIILGDVSASTLPQSFCAQTVELVRDFGAGPLLLRRAPPRSPGPGRNTPRQPAPRDAVSWWTGDRRWAVPAALHAPGETSRLSPTRDRRYRECGCLGASGSARLVSIERAGRSSHHGPRRAPDRSLP